MKTKKTPAPRRAGNTSDETAFLYAERVIEILDGDEELILLFLEFAESIAKRRRALRKSA